MNQNESDRDYVNNKIKEMKNRFEKKTDGDKVVEREREDQDLPRLRHRETKVKDNISLCQNRLEEFEQKRKKNQFSDITKKFGLYTLINTVDNNKDSHEIADELRRIRNSIVYKDEGDFRSKLQKFESKKPNEQKSATDPEMKNFLKETHIICENYENEIEFLRERLKEVAKHQKSFQNLEIKSNIVSTEFEANMKISFLRQMKNLTEKDISFVEISNIYNEKICELFEENEKLQVLIKRQNELENENKDLKMKLLKSNEEKESSIKNISEIYGVKFTELFEENDKKTKEIEDLKKSMEAKENKFNIENKNLKEIVVESNNLKLHYEDRIKNFEEKIKSFEENLREKESQLKEKEEKMEMNRKQFETDIEKYKEDNRKIEEENLQNLSFLKNKENELNLIKAEYEEKSQKTEKKYKDMSNDLIIKETEIKLLKEKLKEQEEKINSLLNSNSEGKISEEKLKEIHIEHDKKILELNGENKKLKERMKRADEENDDLREIITKDQITLKELKDFKIKSEINNEANNIIIEENHLLRNEIKLFKQRCEEEIGKIEDLNKKLKEKDEEKQKVLDEFALLEKKIENLNKLIEDYKEKIKFLKEKEKEYENSRLDLESKFNKSSLSDSIVLTDTETISTSVNNGETNGNDNGNNNSLQTDGQYYNNLASIDYNKYQINLLKIFLSDYIYHLYLYDNSLNLQKIVEIILNNFNFYLGTIFNRKDNFNLPSSLVHEFLEDLVLKIFDTCVAHKIQEHSLKNKEFNINSMFRDNNSSITQDEITIDVLKKVSEEIENTNSLSNINSILNKEKSLDDIIYIFVQKYKKLLDLGVKYFSSIGISNVHSFILKDVGQIVSQKVAKYTRGLKEQIRTLVEYVVVNIHSGKLMSNANEIYNFKDYSSQIAKRDLKRDKDTLYTKGNITSAEAIDNLVSAFKNESKTLTKIIFDGVLDNKSEFTLGKISTSMMIYCNNLTNLTITNSNPTHKQLVYIVKLIENLKNLKHLDLSNNNIGDEGLQILSESLKFNKNIISINLSNNKITEKGGFYMADAMIKNQTIEFLNISNNSIKDTGLSSLLTVLTNNNTKLKFLDLSNNQFIPSDFKNVADLISNSNNLQSIDLSFNKIDQPSSYSLGLALKQTKSLEVIKLNSIDLNEEAAPLLLKNLSECGVTEIHLDNNPFGEIGAIIFANVLKPNKNLKIVSIRRSRLTSMFMMCLSKVLLFNETIEHIHLEDNMFDEESVILMANTIKEKKVKIHFTKSSFGNKILESMKNVENFVLK